MEFLGIGYQEVLVILVVLLVVVGPERLPRMAYQMGKAVRTLQEYARAVRDEFHDEFDYIEEQYRTVKGEVDTAREDFRSEQSRFNTELRQLNTELKDATEPLGLTPPESPTVDNVVDISTAPSAAAHGVAAAVGMAAGSTPEADATPNESSKPQEPPAPPLVF